MMRIPLSEIAPLFHATIKGWLDDGAPRLGAALAYYMALSLAPAVVVILAIASLAFGEKAAEGQLVFQIKGLVGYEGAAAIETMLQGAHHHPTGAAGTIIGLLTLFFGATGVVAELQEALNIIWKVRPDPAISGLHEVIEWFVDRLLSFALILGAGALVLFSMFVDAWFTTADLYLNSGAALPPVLVAAITWVVTFVVVALVCAFLLKALPRATVEWKDVIWAGGLTGILFMLGKLGLATYLRVANFADAYGALGSFIALLVWVYYTAQVFFLGAEFAHAFACRMGSRKC